MAASTFDVRSKLQKGEYQLKQKDSKAAVWTTFSWLIDFYSGKVVPYVQSNACMHILAYTVKIGNSHQSSHLTYF